VPIPNGETYTTDPGKRALLPVRTLLCKDGQLTEVK
jgi:hypothetical protein